MISTLSLSPVYTTYPPLLFKHLSPQCSSLIPSFVASCFYLHTLLPSSPLTVWRRHRDGERHGEIALWLVVIWSLILTDPYQPPAHCTLFTLLLHQTKWLAGWLQDTEALSLLPTLKRPPRREAVLTSPSIINNDKTHLITASIPPLQLLRSCFWLYSGALSSADGFKLFKY